MAKKRHIVSIDIGTHSVKAAYLEQKHDNGEITISHSAVVEYEERKLLGRGMQITSDSMQVAVIGASRSRICLCAPFASGNQN